MSRASHAIPASPSRITHGTTVRNASLVVWRLRLALSRRSYLHPETDTGASYGDSPLMFDLLFRNYIHEFGFISKRRFKRECRPRPTEPEISFLCMVLTTPGARPARTRRSPKTADVLLRVACLAIAAACSSSNPELVELAEVRPFIQPLLRGAASKCQRRPPLQLVR